MPPGLQQILDCLHFPEEEEKFTLLSPCVSAFHLSQFVLIILSEACPAPSQITFLLLPSAG